MREGDARRVYPTEVDRWYDFLYQNHEKVEEFVRWANELASRHKLTPLRPVVATPLVLKMRDEELEIEAAEAEAAAAAMRPASCFLCGHVCVLFVLCCRCFLFECVFFLFHSFFMLFVCWYGSVHWCVLSSCWMASLVLCT